jgi:hypothetical protein
MYITLVKNISTFYIMGESINKSIAVASYNTSWLGDLGKENPYASEKHLFAELFNDENETNNRRYFENAIDTAVNFWQKHKDEHNVVIGFQEMNNRDEVKKQQEFKTFNGGTSYIIEKFNTEFKDTVCYAEDFIYVDPPYVVPGLLTIWSKGLGTLIYKYTNDLNFPDESGSIQKGRPIMIVFTENNYIFINLHGPNFPTESDSGMTKLRINIEGHLNNAFKNFKTIHKSIPDNLKEYNIFVMGDFNDPYNAINPNNPLILNGDTYCYANDPNYETPKSCCYNFNSSCENDLFGINEKSLTEDIKTKIGFINSDELLFNKNECLVIKSEDPNRSQATSAKTKARSLGDRGKIANYRFTGDYVMGLIGNINQPLTIYRINYHDGFSKESDHEMVYAIFNVNTDSKGGSIKKQKLKHKKNYSKNKKNANNKKSVSKKQKTKTKKVRM